MKTTRDEGKIFKRERRQGGGGRQLSRLGISLSQAEIVDVEPALPAISDGPESCSKWWGWYNSLTGATALAKESSAKGESHVDAPADSPQLLGRRTHREDHIVSALSHRARTRTKEPDKQAA